MKNTKILPSLLTLSMLAAVASGCLGKDSGSGGSSGNSTVACKENTYETCVEFTASGSQSCEAGNTNLGSSCGALKDTALSSCTTSSGGVGMVTYYQPAFYLYLKSASSLSCPQALTALETGCSNASGAFADLNGRHSSYNCL